METQAKIIIMIGAPGSGKSTYVNKILKENPTYKVLSSDAMRKEFGTGEDDQSVTAKVFATLKYRLNNFLQENQTVIVDATNINIKDRKSYIDSAKLTGHKIIAYVFVCNKQTLLERNKIRGEGGGRNVPEFVIDKMIAKYQDPTKQEGFDEINYI